MENKNIFSSHVFNKIDFEYMEKNFIGKNLDFIKDSIKNNDSYKLDNSYNYSYIKNTIESDIKDYFTFNLYEYNFYNKIIRKYILVFNADCICYNIISVTE